LLSVYKSLHYFKILRNNYLIINKLNFYAVNPKIRSENEQKWVFASAGSSVSLEPFLISAPRYFLFEVEKNKIRPLDKADEYWKNIQELRSINSADFRSFNKDRIDSKKFKEAVRKIVSQLALRPKQSL